MAEVDFGDSELFEQLEEQKPVATHLRFDIYEDKPNELQVLRDRLEEYEETIERLNAENDELKRKIKTLTPPSGLKVDNTRVDGPLLHILYGNNNISKECRQDIEESISSLILKHQQEKNPGQQTCYVPPQNSSFCLDHDQKDIPSDAIKKIKEAFSVVGSVLYFTSFCLDKLGQPLLNDNPQLTDGWEVPKYPQVFTGVMTLDGQELQVKEKRAKPSCFNCGEEGHQLRDCPQPKDMNRINEKRKEFSQGNAANVSSQRYHFEEVEERFKKYKPGVVSQELLDALGLPSSKLPPFIYRMRELGYPPGWLKEAAEENSGLALYDGNASTASEEENGHGHKISYDVSKLVDFPGFNVVQPANIKDEYRAYGSIPMQHQHMKQNFAAFLSTNYPGPGSGSKRRHESESTPRESKKRRSNPDSSRCSDMDLDSSDQGSPGFKFQPPLPPNSPYFSSPPPLPPGTPPVTPTPPPLPKGTPPAYGSPAVDREGSEDGLTLEELEEQQRLLWAALEKADTNSDSETPPTGTPVASSPSVSTPARPDVEMEDEEGTGKASSRNGNGTPASPDQPADTPASPDMPAADTPASPEESTIAKKGKKASKVKESSAEQSAEVMEVEDSPASPDAPADTPASPEEVKTTKKGKKGRKGKAASAKQSPEVIEISDSPASPDMPADTPASPEEVAVTKPQKSSEVKEPSAKQIIMVNTSLDIIEMFNDDDDDEEGGKDVAAPQTTAEKASDEVEEPDTPAAEHVPDRSRFQAGIVPFEDTPEFTEVAEATGTYLRIRDLLKDSPRNQAKVKK